MTFGLKPVLNRLLGTTPIARVLRSSLNDAVPVFMLHRFADSSLGTPGHSPADLRRDLAYLRRNGYHLRALGDLTAQGDVPQRRPTVVFTIDDGYSDFRNIALPIFAEFDCPVTVFVATGIVDGEDWFWWDKITYAFDATLRRGTVNFVADDIKFCCNLQTADDRIDAANSVIDWCKLLPDDDRKDLLRRIALDLEVHIPEKIPDAFAPLSWDDIASCSTSGLVSFGPHTITHPVLTATSEAQARQEIEGSWTRLRAKCPAAIPILCFPFGSYSAREVNIAASTELIGACTTDYMYAPPDVFSMRGTAAPFMVPRLGYPRSRSGFLQIVTGFERVKMAVRHGIGGWHSAVLQRDKRAPATV